MKTVTERSGLDRAMDRVRQLQRRQHDLTMNKADSANCDAELEAIRLELKKLEPIRRQWIRQRFFSGRAPGE